MKLGLSTWSLLGLDLFSAVRTIGDAGFDYIEIWGEVPHGHPLWVNRNRLRGVLSTYNMTLSMHAPFTDLNPANPFQPVKGAVEKTLEEFVKFSEFLGARVITIHPGSVHSEQMVANSVENAVSTMRKMVKTAGGRVVISVENQGRSRSKYLYPLASTPESLELILAEVDGLRFTLDTGHAHLSGLEPTVFADRVGSKLVEVHLNDNTGTSDDHLIPGRGTATLKTFVDGIAGSDVLLCLELDPYRYLPDEAVSAALSFKAGL